VLAESALAGDVKVALPDVRDQTCGELGINLVLGLDAEESRDLRRAFESVIRKAAGMRSDAVVRMTGAPLVEARQHVFDGKGKARGRAGMPVKAGNRLRALSAFAAIHPTQRNYQQADLGTMRPGGRVSLRSYGAGVSSRDHTG
jgi:hypothetical protein